MENTQKKIYTAELYKLSEEFKKEVTEQGLLTKVKLKILAMLTRFKANMLPPLTFL